jgi:hypothetical protein
MFPRRQRTGRLVLVISLLASILLSISGCSFSTDLFNRNSPTPTASATLPPPTPTRRPTSTITPSPTPPAVLVGEVIAGSVNLRAGPGGNYKVIMVLSLQTKLIIIERTLDNVWYHVKVVVGEKDGWVSAEFVGIDFDPSLIPYSKTIKPTSTQSIPNAAIIRITNSLNQIADIALEGPENDTFSLQPSEMKTIQIPSGKYQYTVTAAGYLPLSGEQDWGVGSWSWNINFITK